MWLDDLLPERDPHAYDLCRRHAARLSVPLGWHLADRRGQDSAALDAQRLTHVEVREPATRTSDVRYALSP